MTKEQVKKKYEDLESNYINALKDVSDKEVFSLSDREYAIYRLGHASALLKDFKERYKNILKYEDRNKV